MLYRCLPYILSSQQLALQRLQEGQTRIVILKIQGGTHSRRHLIDEAENAVVAAGTVLIHELVLGM